MATIGRAGVASALVSGFQFLGHQQAGAGRRRVLRDAVGRGLRPVSGAEGIHDEQVAQRRVLARRGFHVLLLALVETAVFQQHHFAGRHIESAIDPVPDHAYRLAQLGGHHVSHRLERVFLGINALFRTAEVRGHHHLRAGLEAELDGRHGRRDARIRGDLAILDRHVEVGPDEDPLARQVEISKTLERHCESPGADYFATCSTKRSMLQV
jgi:hypothetical protein